MKREEILPIDKGYAWVIVLAASGTFLLAAGGYKIQGVLMVEVIEKFDGVYTPPTLLWVFTATTILGSVFSPVIGYLIVKLGHRAVSMMGILALTISQIGLAYAFNLPTLLIFHSLPAGFGYDAVIVSALLVSRQYFVKRTALAIGLIAGGSGLGTFILPNMLRPLFEVMDFSGALLLYAGFNLQFLCLSALLRPISYYEELYADKLFQTSESDLEELLELEDLSDSVRARSSTFSHSQLDPKHHVRLNIERNFHSTSKLDTSGSKIKHTDTAQLYMASAEGFASSIIFANESHSNLKSEEQNIKEKVSWRILLMPNFLMFCTSIMIFTLANSIVYNCVPALGKELGVPKDQVALALALAGALEIPCRIGNGFLADRKWISVTAQYSLCLFGAGVFSLLPTVVGGLPGAILALVGMSSMGISVFSLMPLLLKELIGEEHVTNGMGIQNSFHVLPSIISSFIAGAIYDSTDSWRTVFFYISGTLMLASVVIWPYLIKERFCRNR